MIRLNGLLDYAFGNFPCLRGFATLGELADNSAPDESYQRPIDKNHFKQIQSFLSNKENTFFPELILGISLERLGLDYDMRPAFHEILKGGIGVATKKIAPNLTIQLGRKLTTQTARTLTFVFSDTMPSVSRIDGNHRLEAVPKQQDDIYNIRSRVAPFCLVIFDSEERYNYFAPYFFHVINYRALPIPKEKNLEIILRSKNENGEYSFTDSILIDDCVLGVPYLCARKIDERLTNADIPYVSDVLKENALTFYLDVCEFLVKRNIDPEDVENLCKTIVRSLYRIDSKLSLMSNVAGLAAKMLIPMVYYLANGQKRKFECFIAWVSKNDLVRLSSIEPENIITIFENIHRHGPYKVFVAMPYISHKRVNDFNKLFKEVLNELNVDGVNGVTYELIPIMRFRGATQRIDQRLIRCIRECDIFIADITGNNENVIFEVGLSEGANKPMLLIKQEDDSTADRIFAKNENCVKNTGRPPFDMDKLQYIPYSGTGYYNDIKGIVKRNLPIIVQESLDKANKQPLDV